MIEGIEKYYQTIANAMNDAIPEEWTSASITAIFYEDSITFRAEYTRSTDGKIRSFETTMESDRAFRDLRKLFKASGKPVWGQAVFNLTYDGKFNMKWATTTATKMATRSSIRGSGQGNTMSLVSE